SATRTTQLTPYGNPVRRTVTNCPSSCWTKLSSSPLSTQHTLATRCCTPEIERRPGPAGPTVTLSSPLTPRPKTNQYSLSSVCNRTSRPCASHCEGLAS